MTKTLNIALFGDLHGRLLLPFYLGWRWQEEHGERLDYALCVGDAGVYRSLDSMEKVARRWAERYPDEMGFPRFFYRFGLGGGRIEKHPVATDLLGRVDFNLMFVPGNHEEHAFLQRIRDEFARAANAKVAVDIDWEGVAANRYLEQDFRGYERLYMLPQGAPGALHGPVDEDGTWEPLYQLNLMALNGMQNYTPRQAWSAPPLESLEILLTHDTYAGRFASSEYPERLREAGSPRLLEFIREHSPAFHFFGHHHWYYPAKFIDAYDGGRVASIGLSQAMFKDQDSTISEGCFGILRVHSPDEMEFDIVRDSWFNCLTYRDCARFLV
jgi:hypothetical protein